jgi:hypothetical protein
VLIQVKRIGVCGSDIYVCPIGLRKSLPSRLKTGKINDELEFERAYYQPNEKGHSIVPNRVSEPGLAKSMDGGKT